MTDQPRKMSEILKEMAERLLRDPAGVPSSEAAHVALMFAKIAWNETVGLPHNREGWRRAWQSIEAENPGLWTELKSTDVDAMIDALVQFKREHYPDDQRRILTCGIPDKRVRVDWLAAAGPGVDSHSEMQLYGLVRTGQREKTKQFLRETRRMSRSDAARKVLAVAAELGIG